MAAQTYQSRPKGISLRTVLLYSLATISARVYSQRADGEDDAGVDDEGGSDPVEL